MERPLHSHRALTAGLSVGTGLAVSAVIYAATIPFDEIHAFVESAVGPFAVGSVAGVGIFAIGSTIADAVARSRAQRDEQVSSEKDSAKQKEGLFRHSRSATPKGVPVIARAQTSLTESEAWADIDSMLDENSPVSCDPVRSKDIYEIALEEMARTTAGNAAGAAVAPDITATSSFVLSQVRSAMAANEAQRAAAPAVRQVTSVPQVVETREPAQVVEQKTAAPLQVVDAQNPDATSVLPTMSEDDLFVTGSAAVEPEEKIVEVPVADYSGHEDMWAAALAILSEAPEEKRAPEAAPRGAHFRKIENTDPVNPLRMSAVAEGASETSRHARVNEILEEEIERIPSQSMRNTSREYLRVIQGGTMSMPRLTAEA